MTVNWRRLIALVAVIAFGFALSLGLDALTDWKQAVGRAVIVGLACAALAGLVVERKA